MSASQTIECPSQIIIVCPSQIGYLRGRPPCVQNRPWQAVVVAAVVVGGCVVAVVVDVDFLWKQTTE